MSEKETPSFSVWLVAQRAGACEEELSAALQQVVKAVLATDKPGTVTLKIAVKPQPKLGPGILIVTDKVEAKAPVEDTDSLYFANDDGELSRSDPRQPVIPGMDREQA